MTAEGHNSDITAGLQAVLRSSDKPLMASEIALQLQAAGHANADKKVVNHLLYGPLKGQVRQDAAYRWMLVGQAGRVSGGAKDAEKAEVPVFPCPHMDKVRPLSRLLPGVRVRGRAS